MKLSLFDPVIVAKRTNRIHGGSDWENRMNRVAVACGLIAIITACSKKEAARSVEPTAAPQASPAASPSLPRPRPILDPKSSEAAVQLAQKFVDLLNDRKFDEAFMLLGPNAPARSEFDSSWAKTDKLHVKLEEPGDQEGAAGSIYLSIPLQVTGTRNGKPVHFGPKLILRRVNDVPGSTEAQRHWHIEHVDWNRR
jgi:hypothetical protein